MKLVGRDGISLELSVAGYQFADITDDRWDSNWLMVAGTINHPQGSWTFTDPCLTAFELDELAAWIGDIAAGRAAHGFHEFIEPNLRFYHRREPEPTIGVHIGYESAPPWLVGDARMHGAVVELPIAMNDLETAAAALRSFVRRFPVRGPS